jgi:hypothetical protein
MSDEKKLEKVIENAKKLRDKVKQHMYVGFDQLAKLKDGETDFDLIVKLNAAYDLFDRLESEIQKAESDLWWEKHKDQYTSIFKEAQ